MNAVQAQESSADPRLLAGYPKVRNVAPTNATSVYSANKAGTVHWAVSTTTDGSIGEEELITPTEGNATALLNGALPITASNTETTAPLTNLTPDGNYYLTAVMVDARDRHSPVKVISFTTPDNTTPAFNTGYPVVSQNDYATIFVKDEDGNSVSFTVKVETRSLSELSTAVAKKEYDAVLYPFKSESTSPITFLKSITSSNPTGFDTTQAEKALSAAESAAGREDMAENIRQAEQAVVDSFSVYPMLSETSYYASAKGVSGIQFHAGSGRVSFVAATRED